MDIDSTKLSKPKNQSYELVTTLERANEVSMAMLDSARDQNTILGVDCEGILRGRPLCLIQVTIINTKLILILIE